MYCRECGANIGDGAKFCPMCGKPQDNVSIPVQPTRAVKWETISLKVSPDDEQDTIDNHEAFGWEFVSSQNVYAKDSHLEKEYGFGDYEAIYNVTETTNFIKLVFRRNKNMDNYDQIVLLESEYISLYEKYKSGAWIPEGEPKVPFGIADIYNMLPEKLVDLTLMLNPFGKRAFKKRLDKKNQESEQAMAEWSKWREEVYYPAEEAIKTELAELKRNANVLLSSNQ